MRNRKIQYLFSPLASLFLCSLVSMMPPPSQAEEITWSRPSSAGIGDWSDAANWSAQRVPGPSDVVLIPGTGSVNLDVSATVQGLTLSGSIGSLRGPGDLTVTGPTIWAGRSLMGSGTLHAKGGLELPGAGSLSLNRPLHSAGPAGWTRESGYFTIHAQGEFRNLPGATFDAQGDGPLTVMNQGLFVNEGLLIKSAGYGTTIVDSPFNNEGTVDIRSGTLRFSRGGTSPGEFVGEGTLELSASSHTITGSISVGDFRTRFYTGANVGIPQVVTIAGPFNAGRTLVNGGSLEFTADSAIASFGENVRVTQGSLVFNTGADVTLPNLELRGSLGGSDDVHVAGLLQWNDGSMYGEGTAFIEGEATIGTSQLKTLCRRLVNTGTLTWTAGVIQKTTFGCADSRLRNVGVLDVRTDGYLHAAVNNLGTFSKSAGTDSTTVSGAFRNNGTVDIRSGTLRLLNGGTGKGRFSGTGALALGGDHEIDGPVSVADLVIEGGHTTLGRRFSNSRRLAVQAGATLTVEGAFAQTAGSTVIDGALVATEIDIQGGSFGGSGTVNGRPIQRCPPGVTCTPNPR